MMSFCFSNSLIMDYDKCVHSNSPWIYSNILVGPITIVHVVLGYPNLFIVNTQLD
jgi:hypothetical protein